MNLGDMRAELQNRGFNHLSTARCNYFLNNAYTDLCEDDAKYGGVWPFLQTTVTSTAPVTISDLRQVLSVEDMTNKIPLASIDRRTLMELISPDATLTGTPLYWYLDDQAAAQTNLVTNPSFETDATNWSTTFGPLNGGATVSRVTTSPFIGSACGQVTTTSGAANEGIANNLGLLPAGTYMLSAYVRGNAGGESLQLIAGSTSYPLTATTGWQRVSGSFAADGATGYTLTVRTATATATTFFVDGVQAVLSSTLTDYFDGDTSGCSWTGTRGDSSSIKPGGDVVKTYPVAADSVAVRYAKVPPNLVVDSDVPLVPDRYCDLIIDGAVIQGYEDSDNLMSAYALRNSLDEKESDMADSLLFRDGRAPDMVASVYPHADWE